MVDHVTIGVPIYHGWEFVAETLASIAAQTHRSFTALLSVDGGDERSADACRPFLADSRFTMVVQPERLGWAGNISWLMTQVDDGFWCYQAHDDLVVPDYLEVLLDHLGRHEEAAIAYGDVRAFGTGDYRLIQPSVTGSPFARQLDLVHDHYVGGAFRGVTRAAALREARPLRQNRCKNFSVDTVWMAAAARAGELHRIPRELYRARYRPGSAHAEWWRWDDTTKAAAWAVHCQQLLEEAWKVEADPDQRRQLWLAAAARLLAPRRFPLVFSPIASLPREAQAAILDRFMIEVEAAGAVDAPACFARPWPAVRALTRDIFGFSAPRASLWRRLWPR
jgi:hypothetical protein